MLGRKGAFVATAFTIALLGSLAPLTPLVAGTPAQAFVATDWPTYGAGPHHTFSVASSFTKTNIQTLRPKWIFHTGDSVTANPVKVGGRIYVGSWDGNFYAINDATGKLAWKYPTDAQPAVRPIAGERVDKRFQDVSSDGGMITSSAWYEPAHGTLPNLVIFGAGYTLYALNADTGHRLWKHAYPGTGVGGIEQPAHDGSRIFTSPVVVGDQVIFGLAADGQNGLRGYVASADLATGFPRWTLETDVATVGGPPLNDGCGSVWSSPTVDEVNHLVITAASDCDFKARGPYSERVFAINLGGTQPDGTVAWVFTPPRLSAGDAPCDFDFGATANLGVVKATGRRVIGIGGKDGYYYELEPTTGALIHATNLVFGGEAGGFIGSTAFDGTRAYGATGIGDFPAEVVAGEPFGSCAPLNPGDNAVQEPSVHAIDLKTGAIAWQQPLGQSFGATTVSNGLVFSAASFYQLIEIHGAANGLLLKALPAPGMSASGVVVSGKSLYYGTGVFFPGPLVDGVYAWTI